MSNHPSPDEIARAADRAARGLAVVLVALGGIVVVLMWVTW